MLRSIASPSSCTSSRERSAMGCTIANLQKQGNGRLVLGGTLPRAHLFAAGSRGDNKHSSRSGKTHGWRFPLGSPAPPSPPPAGKSLPATAATAAIRSAKRSARDAIWAVPQAGTAAGRAAVVQQSGVVQSGISRTPRCTEVVRCAEEDKLKQGGGGRSRVASVQQAAHSRYLRATLDSDGECGSDRSLSTHPSCCRHRRRRARCAIPAVI